MAERADLQIALGRSKEELAVVQEQATRSRDEADQLRDALATSDDSCARCQNSLADTETALVQARVDLDLAHAELTGPLHGGRVRAEPDRRNGAARQLR